MDSWTITKKLGSEVSAGGRSTIWIWGCWLELRRRASSKRGVMWPIPGLARNATWGFGALSTCISIASD
ncbi:hypothetical protein Tco_1380943 [Tanacetum coccineum]